MISLDCLQEIVFHIVFNHQTAEQMNIIENELTAVFFPPAALGNQSREDVSKKVENGIENTHSDMQFKKKKKMPLEYITCVLIIYIYVV